MKILKLEAENVKRIRVVSINPDGSVIQLSGKNGAGKSSVLDSIVYALAGGSKEGDKIPAQALRRGEKQGKIVLDLGDGKQTELQVTRTFSENGASQVIVKNAVGATYPSPATVLKALLGKFTFDPLEFARSKPSDQLNMLRHMVKLDVDLDELAELNERDYNERRDVGKEVTALESRLRAIDVPEGTPEAPLDVSTMVDTLQRAADTNTAIERDRSSREQTLKTLAGIAEEISALGAEATSLRQQAKRLEAQAQKRQDELNERRTEFGALPPLATPVDTAKLAQEIEAGRRINEAVQARARRDALLHEYTQKTARHAELDNNVKTRRQVAEDAIKRGTMPIKGLGFTDDGVTFDGLPLEQASGAEQLRVSVAIAMAANPRLRVIRIKDGSLLDADSLKMIAEMADAADYQIWMEVVDTSGTVGIVMEDGMIAAVNSSTVSPVAKTPKKTRAKNGNE